VWIGGLAALALIFLPAARQALEPAGYARLLNRVQRRLDRLGWLSLLALLATGMFQMSANPNYTGFLSINSTWAAAILVKHIAFAALAGTSAWMTWGILPGLERLALRGAEAGGAQMDALRAQERRLLWLNLALGVVILGLTALARAA
jgi:uncharacterized membrane protein